MKGYWNNESATKDSIENGWMKSGDLAVIDEEVCIHNFTFFLVFH